MVFGGQQIAVSRGGVDAGEHRLRSLKERIVQADPDCREVDAGVDGDSPSRGVLMDIVHDSQTDGQAHQVAHEFHYTAHRGVTGQSQPERCLLNPLPGDR